MINYIIDIDYPILYKRAARHTSNNVRLSVLINDHPSFFSNSQKNN